MKRIWENQTVKVVLVCLWLGLPGGLPASAQPVPRFWTPTLQLISTNHGFKAQWDMAGYYFLLQSSTNLGATNWISEASASPIVASNAAFFQNHQVLVETNSTTNMIAFGRSINGVVCDVSNNASAKFFRMQAPTTLPLSSFALFYEGNMELSQAATMIINGPVYAGGDVDVGTTASIIFNGPVTCEGEIGAPLLDGLTGGWETNVPSTWNTSFNGSPPALTNMPPIYVPAISTNNHALIDIPPPGESPTSYYGNVRLYNQAQMLIYVTNDIFGSTNAMVSVRLQSSYNGLVPGADPSPTILLFINATKPLSFLTLTNHFYDQREYKTNIVTDIDIGLLTAWMQTNTSILSKFGGAYPTIMYVADQRSHFTKQMTIVRLEDAAQLPSNLGTGFTVITPNPLYVWGNYNVQTATSAANASAGTTNTAFTVPAALFSDALTVLSPQWNDAVSYTNYSQANLAFDAMDDTVNAVIVTGNMPSTDSTGTGFSGGVHNLARFLEDWSNANLWLNTSLCRLWTSQTATNQFRNPAGFVTAPVNPYYNPPTRHYSYDQQLPFHTPPGMLILNLSDPAF
jgi:hypothetical protein